MSEWKRDENGRLYREFGNNCREYETDYIFAGGKEIKKDKVQQEQDTRRCPFKSIVNNKCVGDGCAFYVGEACIFAKASAQKPVRNTAGLRCPINKEARPCSEDCAIFNDGCMFTTISGMKGEDNESV